MRDFDLMSRTAYLATRRWKTGRGRAYVTLFNPGVWDGAILELFTLPRILQEALLRPEGTSDAALTRCPTAVARGLLAGKAAPLISRLATTHTLRPTAAPTCRSTAVAGGLSA